MYKIQIDPKELKRQLIHKYDRCWKTSDNDMEEFQLNRGLVFKMFILLPLYCWVANRLSNVQKTSQVLNATMLMKMHIKNDIPSHNNPKWITIRKLWGEDAQISII